MKHVFRKAIVEFNEGEEAVYLVRYMGKFAWVDSQGIIITAEAVDSIRDGVRQIRPHRVDAE